MYVQHSRGVVGIRADGGIWSLTSADTDESPRRRRRNNLRARTFLKRRYAFRNAFLLCVPVTE